MILDKETGNDTRFSIIETNYDTKQNSFKNEGF